MARTAIFEWIEIWYNRQWACSALDYQLPAACKEDVLVLQDLAA